MLGSIMVYGIFSERLCCLIIAVDWCFIGLCVTEVRQKATEPNYLFGTVADRYVFALTGRKSYTALPIAFPGHSGVIDFADVP
jgi:hypothetical protein